MGFELRGHTILSDGEFVALTRSLEPDAQAPPALVAWHSGEYLSPQTLQTMLETLSVLVVDDRGHELLSLAARRLNLAVGRDEFDLDELPAADPGEL